MGGIFSQPHIGLITEAGREAIIPLERQARGATLWMQVGREIGLMPNSTTITNSNYNRANSLSYNLKFTAMILSATCSILSRLHSLTVCPC